MEKKLGHSIAGLALALSAIQIKPETPQVTFPIRSYDMGPELDLYGNPKWLGRGWDYSDPRQVSRGRDLSPKERATRDARRKMAKASRKINRRK